MRKGFTQRGNRNRCMILLIYLPRKTRYNKVVSSVQRAAKSTRGGQKNRATLPGRASMTGNAVEKQSRQRSERHSVADFHSPARAKCVPTPANCTADPSSFYPSTVSRRHNNQCRPVARTKSDEALPRTQRQPGKLGNQKNQQQTLLRFHLENRFDFDCHASG